MSAYAPAIEKMASDAIGEPVRVGNVHASLFPGFHLQVDNVTIGNAQDIKVSKAVAYMSLGSAFGAEKEISRLVLDGVTAQPDAVARTPKWLATDGRAGKISIERVVAKGVKMEGKGSGVPAFDADVLLASDRSVRAVTVGTSDGRFTAELTPREGGTDVDARGRSFTLPFGPQIEITDFTAKGRISGSELKLTQLEALLYNGQAKGTATISWGAVWSAEGDFELQRMELEPAMKALKADITSDGSLEAKGHFLMQSPALETLFDTARIDAAFAVHKGNFSGLDLVRALQSPSRDGIAGGKTKFDELTGNFSLSGGRFVFNGVKVSAGALSASGQGEITPSDDVSGKLYVELRSSANVVRGNFRVQGTTKGMVLKP